MRQALAFVGIALAPLAVAAPAAAATTVTVHSTVPVDSSWVIYCGDQTLTGVSGTETSTFHETTIVPSTKFNIKGSLRFHDAVFEDGQGDLYTASVLVNSFFHQQVSGAVGFTFVEHGEIVDSAGHLYAHMELDLHDSVTGQQFSHVGSCV